MPLVNSILKTVVRREPSKGRLIIEDLSDQSQYEIPVDSDHQYIPGEILHIRVESFEKNMVIGESDKLAGPVVHAEIEPGQYVDDRLNIKAKSTWDPVEIYGEQAARHFFPNHSSKKYKSYVLQPLLYRGFGNSNTD